MSVGSSGIGPQQFFHFSLLSFTYHSAVLFEQYYSQMDHITAWLSSESRQWQWPAKASLEGVHLPSIPLLAIPVYSDSNPSSALYTNKIHMRELQIPTTWIPEYVCYTLHTLLLFTLLGGQLVRVTSQLL